MCTGLRGEGTSDCQLYGQDGVCVAVAHAVTSSVEGAYIVCSRAGLGRTSACELGLRGCCDLLLLSIRRLSDIAKMRL